MTRKIICLGIIFLLILLSCINSSVMGINTKSNNYDNLGSQNKANTLYVGGIGPNNYSTIQSAINDASSGDTVFIYNLKSPYFESLTIEKSIYLVGQDRDSTILYGCNRETDGIIVKADNVKIESLTIKNFRSKNRYIPWDQAGIKVFSSNVTIDNNRLISNRMGVEIFSGAFNLTITNNIFIEDSIMLSNYGTPEQKLPDIVLEDFLHTITGNTVNGKPLYYITNAKDYKIPEDAGHIILVNSTNITIKDIQMSKNDFSLILAYCSDCLMENLSISDTDGEILFFECTNFTIQNNTINNTFKALCLEYNSCNNIIRYNNVSNSYAGLSIFTNSSNNTIYKNEAYNNFMSGIEIITTNGGMQRDNNITKNKFYNNKIGVHLYKDCRYNNIEENTIKNNQIGILLQYKSCYNNITKNNIQKNLIPALYRRCKINYWNQNYWNRPRILPKLIPGTGLLGFPRLNYDWHPAKQPYEI